MPAIRPLPRSRAKYRPSLGAALNISVQQPDIQRRRLLRGRSHLGLLHFQDNTHAPSPPATGPLPRQLLASLVARCRSCHPTLVQTIRTQASMPVLVCRCRIALTTFPSVFSTTARLFRPCRVSSTGLRYSLSGRLTSSADLMRGPRRGPLLARLWPDSFVCRTRVVLFIACPKSAAAHSPRAVGRVRKRGTKTNQCCCLQRLDCRCSSNC